MGAYILRRLLLVIPTLFGIMLINFALTQFVPGGPIEPDRQRIGAVDTYLASYVSDVWALIALQTRRVRPGAEIVVDGSRPPEQIAAEVHRQIVARFP